MSAPAVLRAAVLARLRDDPAIAVQRVIEGQIPREAAVPLVQLRDVNAADWGTKDRAGREVRIGLAIRDAGDSGARVQAIGAAAESALLSLPAGLPGWRVVSAAPVRSSLFHEGGAGAGQRWTMLVDVRFRLLEDE
ncbi:DUF3168 domain-containing protein [Sphingomonas sp.]|jgi:hypothetical protein|uniref:DUF3168 domain-containing protein n=1 Tax=Sphingomonas sp. TaxID=28214 RepID=UPI0035C87338